MANFFGKVHVLANFATECDKVLKQFESMMFHEDYNPVFAFNSKESFGVRLVGPHVKHSIAGDLSNLEKQIILTVLLLVKMTNHLENFIGNRFNILF